MIKEMRLDISNFGPIKEANIELKKLNVIAGNNGSGKSTSSKLLSCFLTANSKEGYYLANKRIYDRFVSFIFKWEDKLLLSDSDSIDIPNPMINLLGTRNIARESSFNQFMKINFKKICDIIDDFDFPNKDMFIEEFESLKKLLDFNKDEHHRYFNVTNVLLNSEFNFSELKVYDNAHVHFYGSMNDCRFSHEIDFNKDRIGAKISSGYINCLNFEDVVYLDSPSIFDFNEIAHLRARNSPNHLKLLSNQINAVKDESDVYDGDYYQKIIEFQNEFENLLDGKIYFDSKKRDFVFKKGNQTYSMKNTASGVKQMGIIQILLENRVLKENSFLIIDEPEVNLHPEWQVNFAKILVLLIKELNIYLYINSHSPQFIEAIEVYSAKYGLIDDSKFYLSKENEDGFIFKDIQRENLSILYDNLGNPYDVLDKIRAENMANGIF